jgi:two-component system, OmpR family, sensor histidine kinase TctE
VWLALVRALRPLNKLEQRIRERSPDDLSPIDAEAAPTEVIPLVDSVNDLLQRQQKTLATQKRFLADAAHQLKTPLAGLRMQADLALRESSNEAELKRSLQQIGRSSIRATRTVNQLLALARADSSGRTLTKQSLDMAELVLQVVHDLVPHAIEKKMDLGYEGVQPGKRSVRLMGHATLLQEMLRNLVDNALHYTPGGAAAHSASALSAPAPLSDAAAPYPGVVTVRLLADPFGHVLVLQVEDNGPGIPAAERELVLQPFYRAAHMQGSEQDGSGLGLAIVQEIAQQHGAVLSLEDAHPGVQPPGLRVSLRFSTEDAPSVPPEEVVMP